MTDGKSWGSSVATRSPAGSEAAPALFDAGCGVSVAVAVGVGVLVGVGVKVAVAVAVGVAVSVAAGVSVASGTVVALGGMIKAGVGVGLSPLQAAPKRRINNRLTISLQPIHYLGKKHKCRLLLLCCYAVDNWNNFPKTTAHHSLRQSQTQIPGK